MTDVPVEHAAVGRAMDGLNGLAERPLAEHVEAFERVHSALNAALDAALDGPTGAAPTRSDHA